MERPRLNARAPRIVWKIALIVGSLLIISAVVIALLGLVSMAIYSLEVIVPIYVGFVLIVASISKLQKRRHPFFLTLILGGSVLALLAGFDIAYETEQTELSVIRGSLSLILVVILISFIIMISFKSFTNRRKAYQSFSFIIFNLGAFGFVLKHLIAPGLNCYACPWASAGCPIGLLQNWVIMGQVPYYLLGTSLTIFAIFGRAFCGWACPFGFLHDIVNFVTGVKYKRSNINSLLGVKSNDPWKDRVGILTYFTRSAVFIAMIVLAWRYAETWFCKLCPAGFIEAALPYRLSHSVAPDPLFVFRVVIFFSLILIALIVSRFWCRCFCPLGHVAGHFNRFSLLRLEIDEDKCNDCGLCAKACPMGLNPEFFLRKEQSSESDLFTKVKTMIRKEQSNCILCGECVEKCHRNALSIAFLPQGASKRVSLAQGYRDRFVDEIQSSSTKLIKDVRHELTPHHKDGAEGAISLEKEIESPRQTRKDVARGPVRRPERPVDSGYNWAFPVSIYIFYRSIMEVPKNIEHLRSRPNYVINYCGLFDDDKYANFFYSHYKGFIDTPIIVVNGQLYLGPKNDNNELLQFVDQVQDSYRDVYIYSNCDNCSDICKGSLFRKAIGDMDLIKGEQYPLSMFKVQSPGAILSSCPTGAIYALYGRSSQSDKKLSDHINYKMREHSERELSSFKEIPITKIDLYMKKDNDLSNEILNIIAKASYQSGGKLRYAINEWQKNVPSIMINGNELPMHNYPTSYYSLLAMIKKYSRI